jgi:glycosyltransferase involved in cell wall biosynthesis
VLSISVVTPSLNQGRFIERTIRSVLEQGHAPLEYVLRDGGSTDETLAILERFAGRLSVVSEPDRGQADAVNKGIRSSTGDVIGWLNSDDVYLPGALALVAELFAARPAVDVLYGDAQLLDADDGLLGAYYTEPWNAARLIERCFLCQPAVFFRRRIVERFGLLDERLHYCMDYEYWLRLAAGGATFAYVPSVLAGSRLHPETKTLSAGLAYHQELNTMLRARLGRVPDSWVINHAHTLVALNRANGRRVFMPYALDVILQSVRLSWRWNRAIGGGLLASLMRPVVAGAKRRSRLAPVRWA